MVDPPWQGFYVSMRHCKPFCLGLNCALGATQMRPFLQRLAKVAECFVHVYSNAGLPNAMGGYDDTPEDMARDNLLFAEEGLINMLGGCCGSTPAHIKARKGGGGGRLPRKGGGGEGCRGCLMSSVMFSLRYFSCCVCLCVCCFDVCRPSCFFHFGIFVLFVLSPVVV